MSGWRHPRQAFSNAPTGRLLTGLLLVLCAWSGTAAHAFAAAAKGAPADAGAASESADSDAISFDRSLLSGAGSNTDTLSRFEKGPVILPGMYNVDLYVNKAPAGRADVRFAPRPGHPGQVVPCFTPDLIMQTRLRVTSSDGPDKKNTGASSCVVIGDLIDGATATFDMGNLRLDISIPQASLHRMPRGYVAPRNLTSGVTAGLLNYRFNAYRARSLGITQTSTYLHLDAGLNLGRWRLRHKSALTWQSTSGGAGTQRHWQNVESYVQRDIGPWNAQLTLGDTYTRGDLFDSVGLSGVQLATDERMLPTSQRGYAPVVRGVARTNAKVTIRQNGVLLYQTTVAPGPFAINDLYPTGYGGDLEVEVQEADGSTERFSVPYASVPQLLRSGATRFQLAIGRLRNPALIDKQRIAEGTLRHGFSNLLTGYTGAVGTRGYFAWLVGGAFNTRWGAWALDATAARTKIPGVDTFVGRSYRLTYSKILPVTDTAVSVAAYRYSTHGYLELNDAMLARDYARRGVQVFATGPQIDPVTGSLYGQIPAQGFPRLVRGTSPASLYTGGVDRPRNRFSITLSQRLGLRGGSLFVNAWTRDYWNRSQHDTQFQVGYNNQFHGVGFSFTATRSRDALGRNGNQFFASFSIPLGGGVHAPQLNARVARDSQHRWQEQMTVNGSAGEDNTFNYSATASHAGGTGDRAISVNGGYRAPYAVVDASAGKGSHYSQASLSVSGAVVAHPGGVTFGQPMGDTVGIVVAPHATGARVVNATGARIDHDGFALVPYLSPYRFNSVRLDPRGLPLDVQLQATSIRVAPRAGSVVMIPFKTEYGRSLIIRGHQADGHLLPFGAQVRDAQGRVLGVVGQNGMALVRTRSTSPELEVEWHDGRGNPVSCTLPYDPHAPDDTGRAASMKVVDSTCKYIVSVAPEQ